MFNFIKEKLKKIYSQVTEKLHDIFSLSTIDEQTIVEIEKLLIKSDAGVPVTNTIIKTLQENYKKGSLKQGSDIKQILESTLEKMLPNSNPMQDANIILMVGINGSGKTTSIGKLAYLFNNDHKKCLIAAADTFRAAAPEQLSFWSDKAQATLLVGKQNQDPSSITFDACQKFQKENFDYLIIDTAGRLQTKENLMQELQKIKKTINKVLPDKKICTLLTIDAMLGQNSLEQAIVFNQATTVDGIILTKLDGTAKGGIVFAITHKLNIPVAYLSFGEDIKDLSPFNAKTFIANLLGDTTFQSHKKS